MSLRITGNDYGDHMVGGRGAAQGRMGLLGLVDKERKPHSMFPQLAAAEPGRKHQGSNARGGEFNMGYGGNHSTAISKLPSISQNGSHHHSNAGGIKIIIANPSARNSYDLTGMDPQHAAAATHGRNFRGFLANQKNADSSSNADNMLSPTQQHHKSQNYQQSPQRAYFNRIDESEMSPSSRYSISMSPRSNPKNSTATGMLSHAPGRRISLYLDNRPRPSVTLPPVSDATNTTSHNADMLSPRSSLGPPSGRGSSVAATQSNANSSKDSILTTSSYSSNGSGSSRALDPARRKYAGFFHDFVMESSSDVVEYEESKTFTSPISQRPPAVQKPVDRKSQKGLLGTTMLPRIDSERRGVTGR
ncbi:hypothetical protein HDU97_002786 [Phlyctochytrium planicorne]|nr:hypothetical protein HDU97_002786 [Phlyctochytrium planicorne]